MLLVVARYKGDKNGKVISKLSDESIAVAVELATGIVLRNRKVKSAYIYVKANKEKPALVKKVTCGWTGKIKVK